MLNKLLAVLRETLVSQSFLPHQVEGDGPEPFAEVGPRFEVLNVAVGKNKSLVCDFVDQVRDGQLHCDKGAQMRAVQIEETLERREISLLHTDEELVLCSFVSHR